MVPIKNVLVIGGGVGGMCAAVELRKLGLAVDLIEIKPRWGADGAGITISGPTLRALRTVGVIDQVLAQGGSWREIDICAADGKQMARMPVPATQQAEDLPPAGAILRPVLAQILSEATRASGTQVRLGLGFKSIQQDAGGVDVVFTDDSHGRYDLVVAADGVNSKVRQKLFASAPVPRFTGQGSWRAILPRTVERSTIYMGATTKAGMNPAAPDSMYMFCLDHRDNFEFIPETQWPSLLADQLEEFGGLVGDVRQRLREHGGEGMSLVYRPLMGMLMPPPWHSGRVVLVGDTAHATTPHLAMGAGIAVEDAVVLPEELQRGTDLDSALRAYAERRYERCRLVVQSSLRLGEIEQSGGSKDEHTQVMREALVKLTEPI